MQVELFSVEAERLLSPDVKLEQVATGFGFVEGPLWDPRTRSLLFSDLVHNRIMRWTGDTTEVFREPSRKSNGLTWNVDGTLLSCEHIGRCVSQANPDGSVTPVVSDYDGKRLNSPNDLTVRSDGTLYFSDPPYGILNPDHGALAEQEQPHNGLYMVPPGADEPVLLATDFERPNGLAFSPDERRLYVADTPHYQIRIFEVSEDGTLTGGGEFVRFEASFGEGRPDGFKVNAEGVIFTTGPGGLWVVDPEGTILAHVPLPEKGANCAWGDEDQQTLYITASTSIYRLRTRVPGIPAFRF